MTVMLQSIRPSHKRRVSISRALVALVALSAIINACLTSRIVSTSSDFDSTALPQSSFAKKLGEESCPVKIYVYEDLAWPHWRVSNETRAEVFKESVVGGDGKPAWKLYEGKDRHKDQLGFFFRLPAVLIHKFLSYSPCRTTAIDDADFYLIPTFTEDPFEIDTVLQMLLSKHNETLYRRRMKDHVIVSLMNVRRACNSLFGGAKYKRLEILAPMVKVLRDLYDWKFKFKRRNGVHCKIFHESNILTVPYVASPHEFKGDVTRPRRHLSAYVGNADYPGYRRSISRQCVAAMEKGTGCVTSGTNREEILRRGPAAIAALYAESTFFLCPGGDTATRKALFDGLALNSIPVVFEEATMDLAYPHYFPGNPRGYSIFIDSTQDLIGRLAAIPKEHISSMQRKIHDIRDSLTYVPQRDAFDATWVMMEELKRYRDNGYRFNASFPNKTELNCAEEALHKPVGSSSKVCRFQ